MNYRQSITTIILFILLRFPAISSELNSYDRDTCEWKTLSTSHFDLQYPAGHEELALRAAELAESGYVRTADYMGHEITRSIPVIIYPSGKGPGDHSHGSPTAKSTSDSSGPSQAVIVSFNGSYAELRASLTHEIVHAFQYDMCGDALFTVAKITTHRIPLWISEGTARYIAEGYDAMSSMYVRDAIMSKGYAGIETYSALAPWNSDALSRQGQSFACFIEKEYGRETIGELIRNFRDTGFIDEALYYSTGKRVDELNREFVRFLADTAVRTSRNRHRMFTAAASPALMIPALSPDGQTVAALSLHGDASDLILLKGKDIMARRTLRQSRGCSPMKIVQGSDNRISWSRDGRSLVLAARYRGRSCIASIDADSGRIIETILLPFDTIRHPSASADGRYYAFSAVGGTSEDIYLYNARSKKMLRMTDDSFSDRYPIVTPDGRSVIFTTNMNDRNDPAAINQSIHQIDIASRKRTVLIGPQWNATQPDLSSDGSMLLFVSDRSGAFNIHRYDFKSGKISRASDTKTGMFNPRLNAASDRYVCMVYHNGGYDLCHEDAAGVVSPDAKAAEAFVPRYPMPFADPGEYSFSPYRPKVKPAWLHIASAGTFNNSYLVFAQSGLGDILERHRLICTVDYLSAKKYRDIDADCSYYFRMKRITLGFGAFRQSNPARFYTTEDLYEEQSQPAFGIAGMEHYGGYISFRYRCARHFAISVSSSSGRYEKKYRDSWKTHNLHMTYGAISVIASYDAVRRGPAAPYRGFSGNIRGDHTFDFTGAKSFTRFGIDLREYVPLGTMFVLMFRGSASALVGRNKGNFQYYIGGFSSLRGYEYNSMGGRNMFLGNVELRFAPIGWQTFGLPRYGGLGNISGVIFFDAGSAWNNTYRFVDKKTGRLEDFKMDFGVGIRAAFSPLLFLKLDFAWPFDNTSIKQHEMLFSIGLEF